MQPCRWIHRVCRAILSAVQNTNVSIRILPLDRWRWYRSWRFGNGVQEIAFLIMSRSGGIFGELRPALGGSIPQIVPYLVLFSKVDLDLVLVLELMRVILGPSQAFPKYIILLRLTIFLALGVEPVLGFPRSGHRKGIRRSLGKMVVCRIGDQQPLPFDFKAFAARSQWCSMWSSSKLEQSNIPVGDDINQERLFIRTIFHYNASENFAAEVLQLANVTLLQGLGSCQYAPVILQ